MIVPDLRNGASRRSFSGSAVGLTGCPDMVDSVRVGEDIGVQGDHCVGLWPVFPDVPALGSPGFMV